MAMELPYSANIELQRGLELTRSQAFLDGERDIFDLLDASVETRQALRQIPVDDGAQKKNLDRALSLLSKITSTLSKAQRCISEQSVHIENLEELATVDTLSGFLNARGFADALSRELARVHRHKEAIGGVLAFIEIENYESLLRQYDLSVAQKALFNAARILNGQIRDMDVAARLNNNEFVLMLVDTAPMSASQRLQEIALRLNGLTFDHKEIKDIHLHASISLKPYCFGDTLLSLGFAQDNEQHSEFKTRGMMVD